MQFFKNFFSKPLAHTFTVTSSNGFHLRPVAKFVSVAKTYSCEIQAVFKDKSVNAKAINPLLSLGLDKGDNFTLTLQGNDASQALKALSKTFLDLMQNDKEVTEVSATNHHYENSAYVGVSIYEGIAIAPLYQYKQEESYLENNISFDTAISKSIDTLAKLSGDNHQNDISDIYLAQKELLLQLSSQCKDLETLSSIIHTEIKALIGTKLESKTVDYQDLLRLVKSHLGYTYVIDFPKYPFILLADDLLPSDIKQLKNTQVEGVILQKSSPTSHTAILLRTAGIPSLLLTDSIDISTQEAILDTYSAVLVTHPSLQDIASAKTTQTRKQKEQEAQQDKRFSPAFTKDKTLIHVYANVTDVNSAKEAKEAGAEGVGLLRTEFLFGEHKPSLVLQEKSYSDIFSIFDDVTVRTLDVGGDKALPYIQLPKEDNPFLGIRGVRLFKSHPDILSEQLHAIFLAAKNRPIKIMFPMISSVEEFIEAKTFALEIASTNQIAIDNILFGIMIEVPSVLFTLPEFDKVVDFYSVGTNDLTQYLFAIERTHATLKTDTLSHILFKVLEQIVTEVTKPLSICGELASHPKAIEKLVKLGFTSFSVTPKQIPAIKDTIRHV